MSLSTAKKDKAKLWRWCVKRTLPCKEETIIRQQDKAVGKIAVDKQTPDSRACAVADVQESAFDLLCALSGRGNWEWIIRLMAYSCQIMPRNCHWWHECGTQWYFYTTQASPYWLTLVLKIGGIHPCDQAAGIILNILTFGHFLFTQAFNENGL